ncbi:hypothetical protein WJX72_000923 [[Myrmecia] bisecta]|uniref:Uncharacterized protein n=1 Tax=[Myrmecia] bisecta TaxID=41462 RepID=A0AAW1QE54_9CHLO
METLEAMPLGNAMVSIVESGSSDRTVEMLQALQSLLAEERMPHRIVTGGLSRQPGEERIHFLVSLRNEALSPLYEGHSGRGPWPADRIIYLNDVYFCAGDILRLIATKGDLVCGFDVVPQGPQQQQGPAGEEGEPGDTISHLRVYDIWVARDALGRRFNNKWPYVNDEPSQQRMRAGLPFPVKCCWNGVLVLNAQPFHNGLRFRSRRPQDCYTCAESLLCEDLIRSGHDQFWMDPVVQVAYEQDEAVLLHTSMTAFINDTRWAEVMSAPPIDMDYYPKKALITCCAKADDTEGPVSWELCHPHDIFNQ